jgi:hypothetical protein
MQDKANMTPRFLIPCFALLLAGCPDDTTPLVNDTTRPVNDTTSPVNDTTPTVNDTGSETEPPSINIKQCDGSRPCGGVVFETNVMFVWDGDTTVTEEYTCLLQSFLALAEDPELINIILLQNDSGDSASYTDMAIGYGDGTVLITKSGYQNGGYSYSNPPERCMLRDASFYQNCIDTTGLDCIGASKLVRDCIAEAEPACPVP